MADKAKGNQISAELIEQKLILFNSSQESVQGMSTWIMHNKSHHQKIVDTWLKVLKKSDSKHKLTLFYLCNDVVQHAKRKKALYYLENFKDHLREAVQVVREFESIKPNIERIFKIWEERKTYDAKFIKELRTVMDGGSSSKSSSASGTPALDTPVVDSPVYKPSSKDKHKHQLEKNADKPAVKPPKPVEETPEIAGEFKPTAFLDQMAALKKLEGDVTLKAKQLAALRIDATSIEAVKQLKDRSHGNEFCRQFEESCVKIEDYVSMLEKEIKQRRKVLSMCEGAEDFYFSQFDEAKVVANAYKNFGARVTNMKKRVDDMKKIIPSTPSPVPSPTADAPSPGNSPTLLNMDDNETVDMDICETEQPKQNQDPVPIMRGRAYTAMVKSIGQPIASLTNIVMGQKDNAGKNMSDADGNMPSGFQGSNILESRIANMLPNLAKGSSNMPPSISQSLSGVQPPVAAVAQALGSGGSQSGPPTGNIGLPSSGSLGAQPQGPMGAPPPGSMNAPPTGSIGAPPVIPVGVPPPGQIGPTADVFSPQKAPGNPPEMMYTPRLDQQQQQQQQRTGPPQMVSEEPPEDTGSSTPVQDEQEEKEPSPPPRPVPASKSDAKTKTNPIDFLSQLLTKTSSSSSSSNFLQTLSLLTNTVKTQYQKKQNEDEGIAKSVEDKPPSPNFSAGIVSSTHSGGPMFTGIPPPDPSSPTGSWSGWKPDSAAQSDPSSPPVISQTKPSDIAHPPLPQRPPLPPEPLPPQPYRLQPPSPQDFSVPTPIMRPSVSQSFMNPPPPVPPLPPNSQQFRPPLSSAPFPLQASSATFPPRVTSSITFSSQPVVLSTGVEPASIRPPQPGVGYNPTVPYGLPPGASGTGPLNRPPPPLQVNQPPPGFIPGRMDIRPPDQSASFVRGPFAAPPPPPVTGARGPWQPDQPPPSSQPQWGNKLEQAYDDPTNWEPDMGDSGDRSEGYAHPWDQPHNYDDEDDEADFAEEMLETTLPPPPKKSILRNRMSSLREVTLVEETRVNSSDQNDSQINNNTPVTLQGNERKPAGILKKPSSDTKPVTSQTDNTQSEFINILKQKSGADASLPPPASKTVVPATADFGQANHGQSSHGEQISTIGVLGNSGRPSSIKSDDMDLDTDDRDLNGNSEVVREHDQHKDWSEHREGDYEPPEDLPPDYDSAGGPQSRPHWPDHHEPRPRYDNRSPRPWHPRPRFDHGGFRPRGGYPPRPRFQDNFRGPPPAKRPYFPPRQRMPYYRY